MVGRKTYGCLIFCLGIWMLTSSGGVRPGAQNASGAQPVLTSVIAFVSTRHDPAASPVRSTEIYVAGYTDNAVAAERLTNLRRLTSNEYGDAFPAPSPDGRRLVFDSNRLFPNPALNTADLFVIDWDGSNIAHLVRGSSATWSPDGSRIAYHASASGTGRYIRTDPGSAAIDSDIFVLDVDDAVNGIRTPANITNTPQWIDDDPDWSPDGRRIAFARHGVSDNHANPPSAELWVMNADGSEQIQLTRNAEEERGPAWSPDGTRIAFACRKGNPRAPGGLRTFEICAMNADGTGAVRLTDNTVGDLTPTWSPDGRRIIFHVADAGLLQLWEVNAIGDALPQALTAPPGLNGLANWGSILLRPQRAP